jgi:hypothetical protein
MALVLLARRLQVGYLARPVFTPGENFKNFFVGIALLA